MLRRQVSGELGLLGGSILGLVVGGPTGLDYATSYNPILTRATFRY